MARLLFAKSATRIPLLGKLGWWLEAGLLKLFWYWSSTYGGDRAYEAGYHLFSRLGPRMKKHRHVMGNLQIAFPDLSQEQRQALAIRVWGNLGGVLAEYPRLHKLVETGPESYTDIKISAASKPVVENSQPAVYVTPHLGNWEIAAATLAQLQIPMTTIYSPQSNPLIDRMVQSIREALGLRFVAKANALRHLVTELRNGRSVGMLPDQRVDKGDPVPYFGVDAPTTTSPAWLAIKMNCPLIPIEIERIGQSRFCAVFHDPIDTRADIAHARTRAVEVTRQINACFEQWIRKHPEHWHCAKRRWPVEAYETQWPGKKNVLGVDFGSAQAESLTTFTSRSRKRPDHYDNAVRKTRASLVRRGLCVLAETRLHQLRRARRADRHDAPGTGGEETLDI